MITLKEKTFEVYIPKERIEAACKQMALRLMKDYTGKNPLFIGVLNGCFMFISDLMKHFNETSEIGFIKVRSYEGMESTGRHSFHDTGMPSLKGRHVVIVEDIVDTGQTLKALYERFSKENAADIKICTFLFKPEAYRQDMAIDYVCFESENKFLLGYGLDYDGHGRNLPEVYILKP